MPNRMWSALAAGAVILGASAALAQAPAQPAGATAVAPVTVQGTAPPKVIQQQAWSFVQSYSMGTPKYGLIGRWTEPVCVQVVNLTPEQAAVVKARIEEVAKEVGLRTARADCKSNVQVVLTSQPQAFMDKVAKADEHVLGFHWPSQLNKAKTVTEPIQAWYKTATRGEGDLNVIAFAKLTDKAGNPIRNPLDVIPVSWAPETVDIPENLGPPGCAGSLISNCTTSLFKNVLVVIDSRAVVGKPLGPLADYLAMMALSEAKSLDGCSALPSILDLMAKSPCPGRDPPDGLTPGDAAFLTSLYASKADVKAISEQGEISDRIAEILIKASAKAGRDAAVSLPARKGG